MWRFNTLSWDLFAVAGVAMLSPSTTDAADTNFAGLIANDPQLATFANLLDKLGSSPSEGMTVFAPTSDAFDTLRANNDSLWDKYVSNPDFFLHFREIMNWHLVTEGSFLISEIFDGSREVLENSIYNITIDQQFLKIDNVANSSLLYNETSSEGVLIVMDDVIIPPHMTLNLVELLVNDDDLQAKFAFQTMANLALHAELDDHINAVYENGLTFLVPPNARFNRANIDTKLLLTPEMKDYTKDFVLAHLVKDNWYESKVFAYNEANSQEQFLVFSELGTHLWITTTENYLRFQSRKLVVTDQVARNGIFHVMDLPVYPPFITDFTEFTAFSTSFDTSDCFRFFKQTMLSSAEISKEFNSSLTMFCPTRQAFGVFNNEDFQRLLEPIWVRHATEFVLNHFTMPALNRTQLLARAPTKIKMLNGHEYELKRSGDRVRIKNTDTEQARTEFGDIVALDGLLHIVDSALTPTAVSRSIYDQVNLNPDFRLLTVNIDFVQLTDIVDRDIPLTMVAPNDKAWQRITFDTLGGAPIIKRHLFSGLFFCDVLANMTEVETVGDNETIPIELRGEPGSGKWGLEKQDLYVGGALVYECDMYARNGVLHFVDRVIGVDYDTVSPTVTPSPTSTPRPTVTATETLAPQDEVGSPSGISPIALPPVIPGVVPSVAASDAQPTIPPQNSGARSMPARAVPWILSVSLILAGLF